MLIAVARALDGAPHTLGFANQQLYVQISVAWRGKQNFSQRTWYPDALTAILIARLAPSALDTCEQLPIQGANKTLWREMVQAFRAGGMKPRDEPETLTEFFADLRVASQVQMPPVLTDYAAHNIRSQGLPARTLRRIYSARPAEPSFVQGETSAEPEDETDIESADEESQEVEVDLKRALRRVLPLRSTQEARKVLRDIQGDRSLAQSVTSSLILQFAADLISTDRGTKPVRMSTVRASVPTLVRHIGFLLQESEEDILPRSRVSSDALEDIYREAFDEIDPDDETPTVRERLVHSIRAFHEFSSDGIMPSPFQMKASFDSTGRVAPSTPIWSRLRNTIRSLAGSTETGPATWIPPSCRWRA